MRIRTCTITRSVIVGGALGLITATVVIFGFVVSHRTSIATTTAFADVEFSRLRARFMNQEPLVDMSRREASRASAQSVGVAPLRVFHTVIFDTRGGQRLVRIDVPYWFARQFAGRTDEFRWLGQLTFLDDTEFDPEAIRLSITELEQRGPGLVAYYRHQSGGQFISWVE